MMFDKNEISKIDKRILEINREIKSLLLEKDELIKKKRILEISSKVSQNVDTTDYGSANFPWSASVDKLLHDKFGLVKFRSLQLETINATLSKRDCILIKPTGGGKSLCYQLPALLSGITLVISPLVSLMQDQMLISEKFGISCVSLDSNCSVKQQNQVYKAMQNDPVDNVTYQIIYITPEKLAKSKKVMQAIEKAYNDNRIARVVIDEIHCCSQWGHDFRPDYKFLHVFKSLFPNISILGLTATASESIIADIKEILGFQHNCLVLRDSFNRPNLYYDVKYLSQEDNEMLEVCNLIKFKFDGQSGIVYCFTQKDCERVNGELQSKGIKSCFYHASMGYEERKEVHINWLNEECKVIVATIAFGMGIDKPNVRFVIHMSMSKSLENYYQESGRAGRDGNRADCVLFWKLSEYFKIGSNLFTEKVGIANLNIMNRFALEENVCKRSFLASIFQEQFDEKRCQSMCSVCADTVKDKNDFEIVSVDVSELRNSAVDIINNAEKSKNSKKITGNKLIGELYGQATKFRLELSKKFPELKCRLFFEKALCHMILEGFLILDFSFGSFNNYTYILAGTRKIEGEESEKSLAVSIRISKHDQFIKKLPSIKAKEEALIVKSEMKRSNEDSSDLMLPTKLIKY